MAQFQTINGSKIDEICIDSSPKPKDGLQRQIHLELSHWANGKPPEIATPGSFVRLGGVTHDARTRKSRFWIEPIRDAQGIGYVWANADDLTLKVTAGKVTNQVGMTVDLVADLGRSEDPSILRIIGAS
jgi:hypothetical protein